MKNKMKKKLKKKLKNKMKNIDNIVRHDSPTLVRRERAGYGF